MTSIVRPRDWLLAFIATLLVLGFFLSRAERSAFNQFDDAFYLGVAYDIRHEGVFTNGFAFDDGGSGQTRQPGMFFAPIYPALLSVVGALDTNFGRTMDCVAETRAAKDGGCGTSARLLYGVQLGFLVSVYLLSMYIAVAVTGSRRIAWLTLAAMLATGNFTVRIVPFAMTEMTTLFFVTAAIAAAVAATNAARPERWFAAAGVLLALTALTRPNFLYLFLACCLCGAVLAAFSRNRRSALVMLLAFGIGGAATLAPWIARNAILFGHPALTYGYDAYILVQRAAFNHMTWSQYPQSLLCWLPDGKGIGSLLFGKAACDIFEWGAGSFYGAGNSTFKDTSIAAAGGQAHLFAWLMQEEVLGHPVKHLLVTVSFALRGAWINHYWGLAGFLCCMFYTIRGLKRYDAPFLIVSLPGWFMLLFNSAVAVNQTRYNLMLVTPFAISIASMIDKLISELSIWRLHRQNACACS